MSVGLSSANMVDQWLNWIRGVATVEPAGTFVQLHTGDPGASGTSNVSGTTDRQAATFAAPAAGAIVLSAAVTWDDWAAGAETLTHVSVWSAGVGGDFLFSAVLAAPKPITDDDSFTLTVLGFSLTPIAS